MKIIKVNNCNECPYLDFRIDEVYCSHRPKCDLPSDNLKKIPGWCPLTDADLTSRSGRAAGACAQCGCEVEKILCAYCSEFPE